MKKFIFFLTILLLTGAVYAWFKNGNSFSYLFYGSDNKLSSGVDNDKKTGADSAISKTLDKGKSLAGQAAESIKSKAGEIKDTAKDSILKNSLGFVKENLDDAISGIGNALGVRIEENQSGNNFISDPGAIIRSSTRVNQPIYFNIKNPSSASGGFKYEIDWGDGAKENGEVEVGFTKSVSHSWDKEGEYIAQFKITTGIGSADYKNHVVVSK